jgi:hypothetical protein
MDASVSIDADEIETEPVSLQVMPSHQRLSRPQSAVELVAIDARQSFCPRQTATHLDNQQRLPTTGDDVEFTATTNPIARRDTPTAPLQMPTSLGFGSKALCPDRSDIHSGTLFIFGKKPTTSRRAADLVTAA